MGNISVVCGRVWQWDTGRRVRIKLIPGSSVDFVHFNNGMVAEVTKENDGTFTAPIPNILLQTDKNVTVYVVVVSSDGVRTTQEYTFKVKPKEKPDDYVYTETEIYNIKTVVERSLEEAKESGEFDGKDGNDGVVDYSLVSNALKGEKSTKGCYLAVDDFSPFDHEMYIRALNFGFNEGTFSNASYYLAVFSKNFINYKEAYKDFFTVSTSRMFSAEAKDLPSIKIPVPDELVNFPLRFSAKIKNSKEECCLRVYVSHADGTKQGGAKSTCSTTSYANSFIDFTAQKGDILYLNYSKYGDSTVQVQDMILTMQDLKDCEYEDFYFKKIYPKNPKVGTNYYVRSSDFESKSLVFVGQNEEGTSKGITCTYNKDISKAFEALQNAIISLGGNV